MTIVRPQLLTNEQAAALAASVEQLTPDAEATTPEKVLHFTGVLIDILRDHAPLEGQVEWWARSASTAGLRVGFADSSLERIWVAPSGVIVAL